jgi:hypothetical protein
MEKIAGALRLAAVLSVALIWFVSDKLTGLQLVWAWGTILASILWYAGSCWWFPFGACWCCNGRGTHYRKDGKVHRVCKWWCKGQGRKLRWGRRAYNFIHEKTSGAAG